MNAKIFIVTAIATASLPRPLLQMTAIKVP